MILLTFMGKFLIFGAHHLVTIVISINGMESNQIKSNLFTIQPNNTKKYLKTKQTLDAYKFTQNKKSVSESRYGRG